MIQTEPVMTRKKSRRAPEVHSALGLAPRRIGYWKSLSSAPICFQFFSEKHRERRVNPLSHLGHRHDQGHGAGWIDPYKSVRRESTRDLVFDHPRSRRRETDSVLAPVSAKPSSKPVP